MTALPGAKLCEARGATPEVALRSTRANAASVRHVEPSLLSEGRRGRVRHVPRQPRGDRAALCLAYRPPKSASGGLLTKKVSWLSIEPRFLLGRNSFGSGA